MGGWGSEAAMSLNVTKCHTCAEHKRALAVLPERWQLVRLAVLVAEQLVRRLVVGEPLGLRVPLQVRASSGARCWR